MGILETIWTGAFGLIAVVLGIGLIVIIIVGIFFSFFSAGFNAFGKKDISEEKKDEK